MAKLATLITSPVIFLVAIPLCTFAAVTTTLAFTTLLIRVLLVYIELGAVLLQNQLVGTIKSDLAELPPRSSGISEADLEGRPKAKKRSSAGSGYSNGSVTPIAPTETSGLGIYGGTGLDRDYEGVGGWRLTSSKDEDVLWTSMNSRLELPSPMLHDQHRRPHHHRSSTAGSPSITSMAKISPTRSRTRTPLSSRNHGGQPLEDFSSRRAASKSTTSLNTDVIAKAMSREDVSPTSTHSVQSNKTTQANRLSV